MENKGLADMGPLLKRHTFIPEKRSGSWWGVDLARDYEDSVSYTLTSATGPTATYHSANTISRG